MGYNTTFFGRFDLDKELNPDHAEYLRKFADTRRMKRDPEKASKLSDPVREKVGLPIGLEAGYFVGGNKDESILDYNQRPENQPGLWCQWVPTKDNKGIEWDQIEKFHTYEEWLRYLIDHFLKHWEYNLNGKVEFQGDDEEDEGEIIVNDNIVEVKYDTRLF
jgi:hypothetical protein